MKRPPRLPPTGIGLRDNTVGASLASSAHPRGHWYYWCDRVQSVGRGVDPEPPVMISLNICLFLLEDFISLQFEEGVVIFEPYQRLTGDLNTRGIS